ncbi:helix-turn-helix domain-containing protein [Promicromonospora alba]|uniref:Helix-turn-helix domain-containing protein n=1 Tax=Promicromonospora alba TaxID=1616110 RepID=A0ABV9HKA1_9MICO
MPRASAADAARTAQAILASATELLAARGFAAVSLDDVAGAAGVTRGAVYHHYGSKAGLFRAVAAHLQSEVAQAVVAAAESAGADKRAQLNAGCHAFLDAITAAPAVRVLLIDAPAVFGWEQWRRLDAESSVVHLREALADVGVPAALLDATAAQLSGAMNEAALWIAQQPRGAEARDAAHQVLDRVLAAAVD